MQKARISIFVLFSVLVALASPVFEADEHSVAVWDFRKMEKNAIPDKSGNGNHIKFLSKENAPLPVVTEEGMVLDGKGGYGSLKAGESLRIGKGDFAIEIAFRIRDMKVFGNHFYFIGNKTVSEKTSGFSVGGSNWKKNHFFFSYALGGKACGLDLPLKQKLEPSRWYVLTITRSGDKLKGYLDTELLAETTVTGDIDLYQRRPVAVGIYCTPWKRDKQNQLILNAFEGTISSIRISDCARKPGELKKTSNGTSKPATYVLEADEHSAAVWDFRKMEKNVIPDKSGYGNHIKFLSKEKASLPVVTEEGMVLDGKGGYGSLKAGESLRIGKGDFAIEIAFRIRDMKVFGNHFYLIGNKADSEKKSGFSVGGTSWKRNHFFFSYALNGKACVFELPLKQKLEPSRWYVLTITRSGDKLKGYLDTELLAEATVAGDIDLYHRTPVAIGIYCTPWKRDKQNRLILNAFEGSIRSIRISDCARNPGEAKKKNE